MTRDEAIKILNTIPTIGEQVDALEMAIEALERKHGKWKHTITYYPYCSECGWMPEEDELLHTKNFCPNCGARMDERREDERLDKTAGCD